MLLNKIVSSSKSPNTTASRSFLGNINTTLKCMEICTMCSFLRLFGNFLFCYAWCVWVLSFELLVSREPRQQQQQPLTKTKRQQSTFLEDSSSTGGVFVIADRRRLSVVKSSKVCLCVNFTSMKLFDLCIREIQRRPRPPDDAMSVRTVEVSFSVVSVVRLLNTKIRTRWGRLCFRRFGVSVLCLGGARMRTFEIKMNLGNRKQSS